MTTITQTCKNTDVLSDILYSLPQIYRLHVREGSLYRALDFAAKEAVKEMFAQAGEQRMIQPIGEFFFPYFEMGAINSKDLFGLDELIIFSFYWQNRNRYKKALDIGANIGLHSTVLGLLGYEVKSFEPDPTHFKLLCQNLEKNQLDQVTPYQAAVSNKEGKAEFVRVLGNTTGSHLAGCKDPYGELEKFEVELFDINKLMQGIDLIKMDVEGHEAEIIQSTTAQAWEHTDAIIEVGSEEKAEIIFNHLEKLGVHSYSQKIGWERVENHKQMPFSHREGSLFISKRDGMPWQ